MNKVFSFNHGSDFHNCYMFSIIDTRESKRQRTETTCCVEVTEVSVQKELQSIELTEDQTKGAESSVSTRFVVENVKNYVCYYFFFRLMTDGGSEQNQLDDKVCCYSLTYCLFYSIQ